VDLCVCVCGGKRARCLDIQYDGPENIYQFFRHVFPIYIWQQIISPIGKIPKIRDYSVDIIIIGDINYFTLELNTQYENEVYTVSCLVTDPYNITQELIFQFSRLLDDARAAKYLSEWYEILHYGTYSFIFKVSNRMGETTYSESISKIFPVPP
jgi:hypothetical protein